MTALNVKQLRDSIQNDAAIRRRQRLQPIGGQGDKIYPPTYPGERTNAPPRHVYELRKLPDQKEAWCVLVDSVQSQANRLEESLLGLVQSKDVSIPHLFVDFEGQDLEGIHHITSLDAPHRVYDAIFRDSLLDKKPFMQSAVGERIAKASPADASALLEASPTALLFGVWHSTGEGGGLGAKFARSLVSEIMAVDVPVEFTIKDRSAAEFEARTLGRRPGSRIDPLGILRDIKIYKSADDEADWTPHIEKALKDSKGNPVLYSRKKGDKAGKPSVINHGNVKPSVAELGITCDYLDHTFALSFASLRRLRFGSPEKDVAARVLLAALGLLAVAEQDSRGYALRSRCDLVCEGSNGFEVVHPDGSTEKLTLSRTDAIALYKDALEAAKKAGFQFADQPIRLEPQEKLVAIVKKSQELALSGKGGEETDESDV